jgi:hypothetical protein
MEKGGYQMDDVTYFQYDSSNQKFHVQARCAGWLQGVSSTPGGISTAVRLPEKLVKYQKKAPVALF